MRNGFTLIEMMVVICLAMMLMALTATGYQKVKHGQDLSIGGGTVKGALQEARAEALKRNQVVCVYFLDGGDGSNFDDTNNDSTIDTDDIDPYIFSTTMYDIPYEVAITTRSGEEISRYSLPAGIAWMTMANGEKGASASYDNPFALKEAYDLFNRKCSLAICFAPSGNAWAEVPVTNTSNAKPYRSEDSYKNIRIYNIDKLELSSISVVADKDSSAEYYLFETEMFEVTTNSGSKNLTTARVDSATDISRYSNKAVNDVIAENDSITWMTVKMNYNTGICELVNGFKE